MTKFQELRLRFRIWRRYWRDCVYYGEDWALKEYKARKMGHVKQHGAEIAPPE